MLRVAKFPPSSPSSRLKNYVQHQLNVPIPKFSCHLCRQASSQCFKMCQFTMPTVYLSFQKHESISRCCSSPLFQRGSLFTQNETIRHPVSNSHGCYCLPMGSKSTTSHHRPSGCQLWYDQVPQFDTPLQLLAYFFGSGLWSTMRAVLSETEPICECSHSFIIDVSILVADNF